MKAQKKIYINPINEGTAIDHLKPGTALKILSVIRLDHYYKEKEMDHSSIAPATMTLTEIQDRLLEIKVEERRLFIELDKLSTERAELRLLLFRQSEPWKESL